MTLRKILVTALPLVLFLTARTPASAQVRRVVVETEGISVACTPGLETALKSLEFVDKFEISVPKQMFWVTFYNGEKFQPKKLHWATDKGEAEVVRFHVAAVGTVRDDGERQILVAGDDRFLIVKHAKLPTGVRLGVMGVVNDAVDPMEIKPDDVEVLTEEPSAK